MDYNIYKFEDVEIGDGVYFDDIYSGKRLTQSNYDEYWEVTGKDKYSVQLYLSNFGQEHFWSVQYKQIRQVEKRTKNSDAAKD